MNISLPVSEGVIIKTPQCQNIKKGKIK